MFDDTSILESNSLLKTVGQPSGGLLESTDLITPQLSSYQLQGMASSSIDNLQEVSSSQSVQAQTVIPDLAGNTLATARVIKATATPKTYHDWVGSTDLNDYYKFTVNTEIDGKLLLNGLSNDADVRLLDSGGNLIAASTNPGTTPETLTGHLEAGTYYIHVKRFSGDTFYDLTVSGIPDLAGNSLADARVIPAKATPKTYKDWVGSTDDDDYYRFTVNTAFDGSLTLNGLSNDADVRLLDSGGNQIAISDNPGTTPETLTGHLGAGTYYIHVDSFSGDTFYNLTVSAIPDLAGNSLADARVIPAKPTSKPYKDWVGSTDDDDYYRFTVNTAVNGSITLDGLSNDADLRLLDSGGNQIAISDNGGTTSETLFGYLNAGTYYIHVDRFSGDTFYNLSLSDFIV